MDQNKIDHINNHCNSEKKMKKKFNSDNNKSKKQNNNNNDGNSGKVRDKNNCKNNNENKLKKKNAKKKRNRLPFLAPTRANLDERINEFFNSFDSANLEDYDIRTLCQTMALSKIDFDTRKEIIKYLESLLNQNSIRCSIYPFGSSKNGLDFCDSDLDLHVRLIDPETNDPIILRDYDKILKQLEIIYRILRKALRRNCMVSLIKARIPIIKLNLLSRYVDCDINISNPFGLYNSIFLKLLSLERPKFSQSSLILKKWAKTNGIIASHGMNSYTLTILIIFFLQRIGKLNQIGNRYRFDENYFKIDLNQFVFEMSDYLPNILNNQIEWDIFDLIQKFFEFYANFDYYLMVISPRLALSIPKYYYYSHYAEESFEKNLGLSVEDPFQIDRNISSGVRYDHLIHFVSLCEQDSMLDRGTLQTKENLHKFLTVKKKLQNHPYILQPCRCCLMSYIENNGSDLSGRNFIVNFAKTISSQLLATENQIFSSLNFHFKLLEHNEAQSNHINKTIQIGSFKFEVRYMKKVKKGRKNQDRKDTDSNGENLVNNAGISREIESIQTLSKKSNDLTIKIDGCASKSQSNSNLKTKKNEITNGNIKCEAKQTIKNETSKKPNKQNDFNKIQSGTSGTSSKKQPKTISSGQKASKQENSENQNQCENEEAREQNAKPKREMIATFNIAIRVKFLNKNFGFVVLNGPKHFLLPIDRYLQSKICKCDNNSRRD